MAEILSEFVDSVIKENRATIPPEKVAQIRDAVLDVFSEKFTPSTPIQELQKEFRTITSLKSCIRDAVDSVKKLILH